MTTDELREAFEEAVYTQAFVGSIQVVQTGPGESRLLADCPTKAEMCRRDEGGHYADPTVDSAWWAWQKATEAERARREGFESDCDRECTRLVYKGQLAHPVEHSPFCARSRRKPTEQERLAEAKAKHEDAMLERRRGL